MNNLIAPSIKHSVLNATATNASGGGGTVSDRITELATNFYYDNLKDWALVVIVLGAIFVMLVCRYYDKIENPASEILETREPFTEDELAVMKQILVDQTSSLKYDEQPHFDRLRSVNEQQQYVNYPGQDLPMGAAYNDYPQQYPNLNNPTGYDYNTVYNDNLRDYYSGTQNTYQNAVDTNITNPLGFSNNFNTTTGDFVGGMTNANKDNVLEYQQILESMRKDLTNSLNVGPNSLNVGVAEPTMIPPYAM